MIDVILVKTSEQSFEMKSQNMHVKTPQSKPTKKEKSKARSVMTRAFVSRRM